MARTSPRAILLAFLTLLITLFLFLSLGNRAPVPKLHDHPSTSTSIFPADLAHLSPEIQKGNPIMSHLGNETLKAELGRAAWKLFHTTLARFPDTPSGDESAALKSYLYLFARLYPCGECAEHFQGILERFPPQTGSRSSAAAWGCHVHNEVNKVKGKGVFDCTKIGDFYDCGCGGDEKEKGQEKGEMSEAKKMKLVQGGRSVNQDQFKPVQIAKEGQMDGG